MMALAGIDMLPPAVGIPVVRREVTAGGTGGEIVVAGALGVMLEHADESTRRDSSARGRRRTDGRTDGDGHGDDGVVVVTELDPAAQPFLDHHRIEGTPVLPGVMGMEAFAEAARLLAPGWRSTAIEDVAFLAPFKWYRDEPRRLESARSARPGRRSRPRRVPSRRTPHAARPA